MMALLELGKDVEKNRRYLLELFALYSLLVLATYVFLSAFASLFIQSEEAIVRGLGAATYIANIYMCHQLPERSFTLFGQHLSLCERCFAIMVGALAAYPSAFLRRRLPRFFMTKWFVLIALVPIGLDGVGQLAGMWESITLVRIFSGFIAAFAIMHFLLAEVFEKFKIGKGFLRVGTLVPVAVPYLAVMLAVLAFAVLMGGNYHSKGEFVQRTMEMDGNASFYDARYIPPHAFSRSIRGDPFLFEYNDPVLMDVASLGTKRYEWGAWVVLALDEPAKYEGKHAFISGGKGRYYYYDAWGGGLIAVRAHAD